ncbi:MAG: glycosyltransferase family 2 protein [Bryobacteraceae bacterium]|nr:glycosyltransferase family 2 protein [Bryobacteraceae bacterium]
MDLEITAVIPNFNRAELLGRTLETLGRQTRPCARVIVADNGSTDSSAAVARSHGAEVIPMGGNLGFAAAVNRGVEAAAAAWVWILNNDVELHPRCLEALAARVVEEEAAFAAPRLKSLANPSRLDGCYDLLARSGCAWRAGHGMPDGPLFAAPRRVAFAPFTALLVRRDAFLRLGGLDERFGSYLEDVDFCLRCAVAGLRGVYVPEAVAYHHGGATHGAWSAAMVELLARNQVLLAAKHFPAAWWWRVLAGQLLWGAVAARHGRLAAWLRGKWRGIVEGWKIRRASVRPERSVLEPLLEACEEEIRRLQRETRQEPYWRLYFAVAR